MSKVKIIKQSKSRKTGDLGEQKVVEILLDFFDYDFVDLIDDVGGDIKAISNNGERHLYSVKTRIIGEKESMDYVFTYKNVDKLKEMAELRCCDPKVAIVIKYWKNGSMLSDFYFIDLANIEKLNHGKRGYAFNGGGKNLVFNGLVETGIITKISQETRKLKLRE